MKSPKISLVSCSSLSSRSHYSVTESEDSWSIHFSQSDSDSLDSQHSLGQSSGSHSSSGMSPSLDYAFPGGLNVPSPETGLSSVKHHGYSPSQAKALLTQLCNDWQCPSDTTRGRALHLLHPLPPFPFVMVNLVNMTGPRIG